MLEKLSTQFPGVKFLKSDYDLHMQELSGYGVRGFPTIILLRDGEELGRKVGAQPLPALKSWIEEKVGD